MKGLKLKRKEKGLSQTALGKVVNLAGNTISYYESGEREPSFATLKILSAFFNCTIDELL